MAKPPFAVGNKVVSKIKATYGKEGEYCRFLEARGVERTLSEGAVEQISTASTKGIYATPTYLLLPQKRSACTRKRQAKRPCLGTEEAAEDDGCSSSARRDNIGDESSTDSSNDDSSSSGEDVNAQRWVFRFGNAGQVRSMTSC